MENNLNQTQDSDNTQNPQQNSVPSDGASNAEDFQSTAPQDALNSQTDSLSVQKTGDPITGSISSVQGNSITLVVILAVVVAVAAVFIIIRLLKEGAEDDRLAEASKPKAADLKAAKKPAAKKKPAKKKSAPNQRRKKTAKKKR